MEPPAKIAPKNPTDGHKTYNQPQSPSIGGIYEAIPTEKASDLKENKFRIPKNCIAKYSEISPPALTAPKNLHGDFPHHLFYSNIQKHLHRVSTFYDVDNWLSLLVSTYCHFFAPVGVSNRRLLARSLNRSSRVFIYE